MNELLMRSLRKLELEQAMSLCQHRIEQDPEGKDIWLKRHDDAFYEWLEIASGN